MRATGLGTSYEKRSGLGSSGIGFRTHCLAPQAGLIGGKFASDPGGAVRGLHRETPCVPSTVPRLGSFQQFPGPLALVPSMRTWPKTSLPDWWPRSTRHPDAPIPHHSRSLLHLPHHEGPSHHSFQNTFSLSCSLLAGKSGLARKEVLAVSVQLHKLCNV